MPSPHSDLRCYRELVQGAMSRALETGKPEVFENEGPQHAQIVVDTMMGAAHSSLDVLAGFMSSDVWSKASVETFLARCPSSRMRVLLDERVDGDRSEVMASLIEHPQVEVRLLAGHVHAHMHLTVADRKHVRLEYDKGSREASVTFGDETFGARATSIFDEAWASASAPPGDESGALKKAS